jgi:hypothetical protein
MHHLNTISLKHLLGTHVDDDRGRGINPSDDDANNNNNYDDRVTTYVRAMKTTSFVGPVPSLGSIHPTELALVLLALLAVYYCSCYVADAMMRRKVATLDV